jgi:magnesium-transporting ATPase (P-type)
MIFVMTLLLFTSEFMWDLPYSKTDPMLNKETNQPTNKMINYTILFNTYIFMQIFNEFCCRAISPKKFNVFANLFSNWYFLAVIGGTIALQIFFVNHAGLMMKCTPLDSTQHAACILWGASVIPVALALKLTPDAWVHRIPVKVDEDKPMDENDFIMAQYSKNLKQKVQPAGGA